MTAEEIEKKIRERLPSLMEMAAYDAAFEIEGAYEKSIDKFYEYQTKGTYNRGYNLYLGSNIHDNISKGYLLSNDGLSFRAGITVSSVGLGEPYSDPADYVFEGAYSRGIHGTTETGGVGVAPKNIMNEWFEGFKNNLDSFMRKYMNMIVN